MKLKITFICKIYTLIKLSFLKMKVESIFDLLTQFEENFLIKIITMKKEKVL